MVETLNYLALDLGAESGRAILGRGGGYMCSPAHIIQADTSMENVEAFIAAVKKHGAYA